MALVNRNRKILDPKRWELHSSFPTIPTNNKIVSIVTGPVPMVFYLDSAIAVYQSYLADDGWILLPSPTLGGTFGNGNALCVSPWGYGSAITNFIPVTSGTVSSITISSTFQRNLAGYSVNILSGNNAGATIPILSSTVGPSATIFVSAQAASFDSTTTFRLNTPTVFASHGTVAGAGDFKKYDYATNTWTQLAQRVVTPTNEAMLVATPSWQYSGYQSFFSALASSGTVSSLTLSTVNWTSGQWQGYQVRIVSGNGAGQIRSIVSSTSTTLTVSSNDLFNVSPSSDSLFSIEGNDDYIYYHTVGQGPMTRYSIKRGVWDILASKSNTGSGGMSLNWINNVKDSAWTDSNAIRNGRYIYCFRGGASTALDVYDIPSNSWTNNKLYAPAAETLTTGSQYIYIDNYLYIQKDATHRFFKYNLVTDNMETFAILYYGTGTAQQSNHGFPVRFIEGDTVIDYIYFNAQNTVLLYRAMIF